MIKYSTEHWMLLFTELCNRQCSCNAYSKPYDNNYMKQWGCWQWIYNTIIRHISASDECSRLNAEMKVVFPNRFLAVFKVSTYVSLSHASKASTTSCLFKRLHFSSLFFSMSLLSAMVFIHMYSVSDVPICLHPVYSPFNDSRQVSQTHVTGWPNDGLVKQDGHIVRHILITYYHI